MGSFPTSIARSSTAPSDGIDGARALRAIPAVLAAAAMGIPLGVYLSPVLLAAGDHRHRPGQLHRPDGRPRGRRVEPARPPDRRRPGHDRGDRLDPRHLGHPGYRPPRRRVRARRLATATDRRRRASRSGWAPARRGPRPRGAPAGRRGRRAGGGGRHRAAAASSCTTTGPPNALVFGRDPTTRPSSSGAACSTSSIARRRRASSRG